MHLLFFGYTYSSSIPYDVDLARKTLAQAGYPDGRGLPPIEIDEAPILPVYFYTHTFLIRPNVKGWYSTILDHHPYKYVHLE